jgi:hypothetical protein
MPSLRNSFRVQYLEDIANHFTPTTVEAVILYLEDAEVYI